jgi:hypothetical protein
LQASSDLFDIRERYPGRGVRKSLGVQCESGLPWVRSRVCLFSRCFESYVVETDGFGGCGRHGKLRDPGDIEAMYLEIGVCCD